MVLENYYIRCEWPEYQDYQEFVGFNDNAEYCPEGDCYYIDAEWAKKCKNNEVEQDKSVWGEKED